MSDMVRSALSAIVDGGTLSMGEARLAMGAVMDGEATPAQLAALLMGLRLSEGLDLDRLLAVSGMRPRDGAVGDLIGLGLIERCGKTRLRATRSGQIVLNEVVLRLASSLQPTGGSQ